MTKALGYKPLEQVIKLMYIILLGANECVYYACTKMKQKINLFIIFLGLLLPSALVLADKIPHNPKMHVVQPLSPTEVQPFLTWAELHPAELGDHGLEARRICDSYLVDISNSGKKKYVFTTSEGSLGLLALHIFEKTHDGFKFISSQFPQPPDITQDAWFFCWPYTNQITKKSELFIEMDNKTYLSVNYGTYQDVRREVFIWEKDASKRVCTTEWIAIHRDLFNQLYAKKLFTQASSYIDGILATCNKEIPGKTRLWIKNDLALSQLKSGELSKCMNSINEIKQDSGFDF